MRCRFEPQTLREFFNHVAQSRHCLCALEKANLGDYCEGLPDPVSKCNPAFSRVCTVELLKMHIFDVPTMLSVIQSIRKAL